jgi:Ca2+:H+ antiporter
MGPLRLAPENALNLLLVFLPLALLGKWLHWPAPAVFGCAALAIVPLAGLMGHATEALADRLGAGVGGLLNATFGNAAELIIALIALRRGLYDVVKASLTGSIIGNILLVLGLAMLAGGARRERQAFDRSAATVGSTLLALAAVGLVVPALFHVVAHAEALTAAATLAREHDLSLEIAIVLFAVYLLSLLFTLRTHPHLYRGRPADAAAHPAHAPLGGAVVRLLGATAGVAVMSEVLVGAVEEASHALGLSEVFVGVIVVAIIGNAAEHSTAVVAALRDRMDLAMSVAIGSSIQIALFVAPLLVFASYAIGPRPMDLRFTVFEVVAVAIAVSVTHLVAQDGESNWLEGVMLLAVYLVLGIAFYALP